MLPSLAWLVLLAVCHSVGGGSARCCIVPLLGIDSNRTMTVIRQQGVMRKMCGLVRVIELILKNNIT